jgi:hypothetical protein
VTATPHRQADLRSNAQWRLGSTEFCRNSIEAYLSRNQQKGAVMMISRLATYAMCASLALAATQAAQAQGKPNNPRPWEGIYVPDGNPDRGRDQVGARNNPPTPSEPNGWNRGNASWKPEGMPKGFAEKSRAPHSP